MFSVYGKAGRVFRGSMEELRKIGPLSAVARTNRVMPVAQGADSVVALQPAPGGGANTTDPHAVRNLAVTAYAQVNHMEMPRHPLTRVEDIMSRTVVTIPDSDNIEQAWTLLAEHQLGQAPVVNSQGMLVGLLSRADLMQRDRLPGPDTHALVWKALLVQSVTELMFTPLPAVAPDTDIRRVARVLLDTGLPGLPVVDEGGAVSGFVSRSDILRAVVADPPLDLWT
jgi:CBS domain-containing protein